MQWRQISQFLKEFFQLKLLLYFCPDYFYTKQSPGEKSEKNI